MRIHKLQGSEALLIRKVWGRYCIRTAAPDSKFGRLVGCWLLGTWVNPLSIRPLIRLPGTQARQALAHTEPAQLRSCTGSRFWTPHRSASQNLPSGLSATLPFLRNLQEPAPAAPPGPVQSSPAGTLALCISRLPARVCVCLSAWWGVWGVWARVRACVCVSVCRPFNHFPLVLPSSLPTLTTLPSAYHHPFSHPFFFRRCLVASPLLPLLLVVRTSWFSLFVQTISTHHSFPTCTIEFTFALRNSHPEDNQDTPTPPALTVKHQKPSSFLRLISNHSSTTQPSGNNQRSIARARAILKKPRPPIPRLYINCFNHCIFYAWHRFFISPALRGCRLTILFFPSIHLIHLDQHRSSESPASLGPISVSGRHSQTVLAKPERRTDAGLPLASVRQSGFDFTVVPSYGVLGHRIVLSLSKSSSRQQPTDPLGLEPFAIPQAQSISIDHAEISFQSLFFSSFSISSLSPRLASPVVTKKGRVRTRFGSFRQRPLSAFPFSALN